MAEAASGTPHRQRTGRQAPRGSVNHGLMHVADLMPTLLEIAGAGYPKTYKGRELPPLMGKSWGRVLAGQAESPRTEQDYLAWEIFGNRAVRQGDWKLRWEYKPLGKGDWELFQPGGRSRRAQGPRRGAPDKVKALMALWDDYVRKNNVILPSRSMFETLDDQLPKRVPDDRATRRSLQEAVCAAQGHDADPSLERCQSENQSGRTEIS